MLIQVERYSRDSILGPIVFPPMVTYLLMTYGVNGTVLILGGISIHTVMAALMLQPIKWHMKRSIVPSEEEVLMQADDSDDKSDEVFVKPGFYIGIRQTNGCKSRFLVLLKKLKNTYRYRLT